MAVGKHAPRPYVPAEGSKLVGDTQSTKSELYEPINVSTPAPLVSSHRTTANN